MKTATTTSVLTGMAAALLLAAGCDLSSLPGVCQEDSDCDDSVACTDDSCNNSLCKYTVKSGFCKIGSACHTANSKNPSNTCQICSPAMSAKAWTASNEGGTCDDKQACTFNDTCSAGYCQGTTYSCNDGLACTTDTCTGKANVTEQCTYSAMAQTCLIGGKCYSEGAKDPTNECKGCASATSQTAWSPITGCKLCGNGKLDSGEQCEPSIAISGANCQSLKYAGGGPLLCDTTTCQYDTKNCTVDWGKAIGTSSGNAAYSTVQAMTMDSAGNLYVAGYTYSATMSVGGKSLNSISKMKKLFVARLDSSGTSQWLVGAILTGCYGDVTGLIVTNSGEVIVSGTLTKSSASTHSINLGAGGSKSFNCNKASFLAGLTVSGTSAAFSWGNLVQTSSTNGSVVFTGLDQDSASGLFVAGRFNSSLSLGGTPLTAKSTTTDGLIAKWDRAKSKWAWAVSMGGTNFDGLDGIAEDNGGIYAAGYLLSTDFQAGGKTYPKTGTTSAILATRLDSYGNVQWVAIADGTKDERAWDIALDPQGVPHISGEYKSADLTLVSGQGALPNRGESDAFAARLNPTDGSFTWAWGGGSPAQDKAISLAADSGGVTLVGHHSGTTVSPFVAGTGNNLAGKGSMDLLVVRLGLSDGKLRWAAGAGGALTEGGRAIAQDSQNNRWVGGSFASTPMTFNTSLSLTKSTSQEGFIARVTGP